MQVQDYQADHPLTIAVIALLPDWVRCLGELSGLPQDMIEPAVAEATRRVTLATM